MRAVDIILLFFFSFSLTEASSQEIRRATLRVEFARQKACFSLHQCARVFTPLPPPATRKNILCARRLERVAGLRACTCSIAQAGLAELAATHWDTHPLRLLLLAFPLSRTALCLRATQAAYRRAVRSNHG